MKRLLILFTSGLLLTLSAPSRAATLFSNLSQTHSDWVGVAVTTQRLASEFMTGVDASTVTGLSVSMANFDTVGHTVSAYLYSDTGGGVPASLLATFTAVDNSLASGGVAELATFSHAGISLAANTRYWIAMAVNENGINSSPAWSMTTSNTADTGLFTVSTPPNRIYSTDSGSTWLTPGPGENGRFSLEGTAVPEPGRASLLLAGCLAVVLRRRRVAGSSALSLPAATFRMS